MNVEIVFPSPQWELLHGHLLEAPPNPGALGADEQLAFVLAAPARSPEGVRLTVRETIPARPQDLEHRSPAAIAPNAEFVAAALTRCRQEGWSLIEAHSHPFSRGPGTTFSAVDLTCDRAKMPRVARLLPEHALHATMVFGRSSLDAHYYDRDSASIRPVHRVSILGVRGGAPRLTRIEPTGMADVGRTAVRRFPRPRRRTDDTAGAATDDRHDRQLPLLGRETQAALAEATVAIVGLGGLGSFTALECAHLGIGGLVLVDPDTVERSNLNRLLGATEADTGRAKVDVYADLARAVAPTTTVDAVRGPILGGQALDRVRAADLLLGCVDNHGARLVLNQLAVQYVIPYLDAGTGARIDDTNRVTHVGGQVQAVLPGIGCLECRGFIDARRAAFDLAPPHVRSREIAHGYGTRDPAPSVVFLNGVVASLLVAQAVQLLSGALPAPSGGSVPAITLYDLLSPSLAPVGVEPTETCPTCGVDGVTALADLSPLHSAGAVPAPPAARYAETRKRSDA
ncbi:HesA/MoeB/ThiF family protein [Embleya sp. NPDC059237]|uniref:HesA/MoeB/ThiF family protein n=1 Tax=Embleya sp. NPDC059237 TaxID=3346784 RepID=UPI00367FAB73